MADLRMVAELAWRQLYPNPSDEAPVSREEFVETAKLEYAYQSWLIALREKEQEGYINIASGLLKESEPLPVTNNTVDISKLDVLTILPNGTWLQSIEGENCECRYVKSTINQHQLLCEDDSMDDNVYPFYQIGKKLKFPKGTHAKTLVITYATNGTKLNESVEVEGHIAGLVRNRLVEIYGGKTGKEDETNNSNNNN